MNKAIHLLFILCVTALGEDGPTAQSMMAEHARAFLSSLSEEQAAKATFPFSDPERFDWHYTVKSRQGMPWAELDSTQRMAAVALLATGLSERAFLTTRAIMELELTLRAVEGRGPDDTVRDPGKYYLSIFGNPSLDSLWAWRFEGHHLSFQFSSISGLLAVTPAFMGENPANPDTSLRLLRREENLGLALMHSLDPGQQRQAIIQSDAPMDIVTGARRQVHLKTIEGLPYAEMQTDQKILFESLLMTYINRLNPEIALDQYMRILEHGLDRVSFAWAGSLESGKPFYYRIHGPVTCIEFDHTANDPDHIHTVYRDPERDFGVDLLKRHYDEKH